MQRALAVSLAWLTGQDLGFRVLVEDLGFQGGCKIVILIPIIFESTIREAMRTVKKVVIMKCENTTKNGIPEYL